MAQLGNLIHDQNFNGNTTISKALRKGAVTRRKPLGDLSNSVQPTPNQSLKKQNSSNNASKLTLGGGSKNKGTEKPKTTGRKALADISNTGKKQVQEVRKKVIDQTKGSVAAEQGYLDSIDEEGFLHNHEECIKARTKALDIDEFRLFVGLNNDGFSNILATSPAKFKPASPNLMELEETPDTSLEYPSSLSDLDSPPRYPKSLNPSWGNQDVINSPFLHIEDDDSPFWRNIPSPDFKLKYSPLSPHHY